LDEFRLLDADKLDRALTRKGYAQEQLQIDRKCKDQEALSTLGDGVLRAALVHILLRCGKNTKGDISNIKQELENNETLYQIGVNLGISSFNLHLSKNEKKLMEMNEANYRQSGVEGGLGARSQAEVTIVSDTVEALIGAIYLDLGFQTALRFIERWYAPYLEKRGLVIGDEHF